MLNRFFRVVVDVVETECGLVNKFEGDAALCVFGAPVAAQDPAGDALRSARVLAERLTASFPSPTSESASPPGRGGGQRGRRAPLRYTVIGDPVNEAARLCELAKQRPDRVLASEAALSRASDAESDQWIVTDSALLRGRNVPTAVAHPIPGGDG